MSEATDPGKPDEAVVGAREMMASLARVGADNHPQATARADAEELDWIAEVIGELADFAASRGDRVLRDRARAALEAFEVERRVMAGGSATRLAAGQTLGRVTRLVGSVERVLPMQSSIEG